jgi:hypothetical protein
VKVPVAHGDRIERQATLECRCDQTGESTLDSPDRVVMVLVPASPAVLVDRREVVYLVVDPLGNDQRAAAIVSQRRTIRGQAFVGSVEGVRGAAQGPTPRDFRGPMITVALPTSPSLGYTRPARERVAADVLESVVTSLPLPRRAGQVADRSVTSRSGRRSLQRLSS